MQERKTLSRKSTAGPDFIEIAEELVRRAVIENVKPEIDCGASPIRRTPGEPVEITADIFADGHDAVKAVLLYRPLPDAEWIEAVMHHHGNDVFQGVFAADDIGEYEYTIEAWVDRFESWLQDLIKKHAAGQGVGSELLEGAELIGQASKRAKAADAKWLEQQAEFISRGGNIEARVELARTRALISLMGRYPDRAGCTRYHQPLRMIVDRERARFGAWYEMFPRSCTPNAERHGSFRDCASRLDYVASMSFDVLYLPPIHPIGKSFRKGKNNALKAAPADPGSPWGIGSSEGGHTAIHRKLGTFEDFDLLVEKARKLKMEIALDLAFQCSPDHPYISKHPEWFRHRPDGTIKYAENPPKKYQDIYPLDFECADWRNLWRELKEVTLFWIRHGVRIFRVDNPHTKSFRFWKWLIEEIRSKHPDVFFLAEAFTRPKVLRHLAKAGFAQSYTYFTWRITKEEITTYFTELTRTEVREYLRPNLFVNTPDILHEYLQFGGTPAFQIRLVLAATLGATYGIYGPPFELCETRAVPGTEEYLDSEKYQIRAWDLKQPGSLKQWIARINAIRKENECLQFNRSLRFHKTDNEQIICYTKSTADLSNIILVVVNLDPHHIQRGWVTLPMSELNISENMNYQVHDLLSDARYLWHGPSNYVELDPAKFPAHIFRLRRKIKTEHDFDYYL